VGLLEGKVTRCSAEVAGRRRGVTWRAVAIALGSLAVLAPIAFYVEAVWPGLARFTDGIPLFTNGIPAPAPVVLLLVLTAAVQMPVLRKAGLSRGELLVVYSILLVAAPLLSGSVTHAIGRILTYYYYAPYEPEWGEFLESVPLWFAPTDPAAVEGFFLGKMAVPWSLLATPVAAWSFFMVCLFTATFCIMALVQRQWVTHERLTFPMSQIPLELVRDAPAATKPSPARLPRGVAFWVGLALSFILSFTHGLSQIVGPMGIPLFTTLDPPSPVGPLAAVGHIYVFIYIWVIAIAFLLPQGLSFSVWAFWLIRVGMAAGAITAGADPISSETWYGSSFPAPYHQGTGAAFALCGWALWRGRRHLRHAVRTATGRGTGEHAHTDGKLSYQLALIGLMLSSSGLVYFCLLAGSDMVFAVALISITIVSHVVWARLGAETGLAFTTWPLEMPDIMRAASGTAFLRSGNVVTMMALRWAWVGGVGTSFQVFPSRVLETFKVADAARISKRRLSGAVVAGVLLSAAVGVIIATTGMYGYGSLHTGAADMGAVSEWRWEGARIAHLIADRKPIDVSGLCWILVGGVVMLVLGHLHLRYLWWPLHPIGYLVGGTHSIPYFWLPFFIGWVCKSLVVRYGGLSLYRRAIPFAVGLIVGDLLNKILWAAVTLVTGGRV
jgi:hypothetical protein